MIVKILKIIADVFIVTTLTLLTQIGGIVWIIARLTSPIIKKDFKLKLFLIFITTYLLSIFLIVPIIAKIFNRERVLITHNITPVNYGTILLNRNYVSPELNHVLKNISNDPSLTALNIKVRYLDACFPFFDGFPLLPHLSHNDGKKIDLSLVYENNKGQIINKSKSVSGYGVFEEPQNNEINQTNHCFQEGYFKYDFPKYLTLGQINSDLRFSENGTKILLITVLKQKSISKIFIEPHLKIRMGIKDSRVRYQGCKSVRHDDHIHIQIK